jgi:hypothetical protein
MLLLFFMLLQFLLPLRTTVQIGADEGFELAKATLCLKGHALYTEVWNDQPPLHTFLITQILKHVSRSVAGPRLVTSAFAILLLASVFLIVFRMNGLWIAGLTTGLLIASPGFLELSSSCMLEIPSLAPAIAALALLSSSPQGKWRSEALVAGVLFGTALSIKLIPIIRLSVAALIIWQRPRSIPGAGVQIAKPLLFVGFGLVVSFVAVDGLVDLGAFLLHFKQTWISHFSSTKSLEYGSPADHPFEWWILFRNWDTSVPAIIGIILLSRQFRLDPKAILPLAWLGLMLLVFVLHRPWWSYYYIHLAIPLCWCAAIGLFETVQRFASRRFLGPAALVTVYVLCAWMMMRLYLQVINVRHSPQTYSSPVLTIIEKFKPFTEWLYTEEPIYSFHAGIPLPPDLAVVPLKRLWAGDMNNAKITAELATTKPGLILLTIDTNGRPFQDLLNTEYQLVYDDGSHRLYALKSIANKVDL